MPVVETRWFFGKRCVFSWHHDIVTFQELEPLLQTGRLTCFSGTTLVYIGESDFHHTFISAGPIFLTPCLSLSNDKQNSFHQRTHHPPRDVFYFFPDANAALAKFN
jgi:hypothetical protein